MFAMTGEEVGCEVSETASRDGFIPVVCIKPEVSRHKCEVTYTTCIPSSPEQLRLFLLTWKRLGGR